MKASVLHRKLHRWGAIVTALPLLFVLLTGMLLQFKKSSAWIQPPTLTGSGKEPAVSFDTVLDKARTVPEAAIKEWKDIDRLDVRPGKGILKVRAKNNWEIQIDTCTGEILQTAYRRSDLIESLHDGSFFHADLKLWLFFPVALLLCGVWVTGVWLFLMPYMNRRRLKV
ncbi:MAG: PepSY-associated TM helix domain-containing protein [Planctomycetota bacterium]